MKKNKAKVFVGNWGHNGLKNKKRITDFEFNIEYKKELKKIAKQNDLDVNNLGEHKENVEMLAYEAVEMNHHESEWLDYFDRKAKGRNHGRNRIENLERQKIYAKKNPAKIKAEAKLRYAVKIGKIKKPNICSGCGLFFPLQRIQGHHDDYNKPLEVRWFCPYCHRLIYYLKSF